MQQHRQAKPEGGADHQEDIGHQQGIEPALEPLA
jgi:hypothetical protein